MARDPAVADADEHDLVDFIAQSDADPGAAKNLASPEAVDNSVRERTFDRKLDRLSEGDGIGRSAPLAEDVAAVDQIVERTIAALKRRSGAIRDPAAYNAAVIDDAAVMIFSSGSI